MKRALPGLLLTYIIALWPAVPVRGHDAITTNITWNREVSRIFYERCVSCHNEKGRAFSMTTYAEARPWAVAIKEEVLSRRMPPWGAVKGFGEFRNDQGLTPEQLEMITSWVEGGVPEGDAKDINPDLKLPKADPAQDKRGATVAGSDFVLKRALRLDGIVPQNVPPKESIQIVAERPDGLVEPLLWLYEYNPTFAHPFLFRTPMNLPAGTVIRGLPQGSTILLLPK